MKEGILLKKLRVENKEFVTSSALKQYCKQMNISYSSAIGHFISRGQVTRIFKGIFYVKSLDEVKLGRSKYNYLELVAKGLELKGVKNWYFGLYTALKLNNMTHEHFTIDYVINDKIFRAKPIKIAGYNFRFVKLKSALFNFGIIQDDLRYSDPEKTILDFSYIFRYKGIPEERAIVDVAEWASDLSKARINEYSKNYPRTVQKITSKVMAKSEVVT
jgi:predicted transcriptional regulator of viral defense system